MLEVVLLCFMTGLGDSGPRSISSLSKQNNTGRGRGLIGRKVSKEASQELRRYIIEYEVRRAIHVMNGLIRKILSSKVDILALT